MEARREGGSWRFVYGLGYQEEVVMYMYMVLTYL